MWILEPFAFGFDILVEGGEGCDFVRIEGEVDRLLAAAIPRLQELDGNDGGFGRDGDEREEAVGGGDLAVFELEALGLRTRKNCSISQRCLYQSTIRQACSAFATGWVVRSRQCSGSVSG